MDGDGDGDPLPEPCRGCGKAEQVSWSPLFGWLCPACRWSRTETYFMRQQVTILPGRDGDPDERPAA